MIEKGQYDSTHLRLASGVENLAAIAEFGRQSGVNTRLFHEALRTLESAASADRGVNLAAIFEELRPKGRVTDGLPKRPFGDPHPLHEQ